jgi:type I restriction enzyme S subunit
MKITKLQKNIPNRWKELKLSDVATKISDGLHTTPKYVEKSNFYFINGNNLVNDEILIGEDIKCVTENEFLKHKKDLSERTILLSINGTIGSVALYNNENVILGKSTAYINCSNDVNKKYIFNLIKTSNIKKYFEREVTGSTIKNLSIKSIKNLNFNCPNILEQNRIVSVLEIWDKSIENLNKKIEIKKQIKKGLMQDLLTGKKRLSGFKDQWELIKLKTICNIQKGRQLNKENMLEDGIYPALNGGIEISGWTNNWNTKENTITISEGGNSCGYINFNKEKFWCGGHCYALNPNKDTDNLFLYQILKIRQDKIMTLRVGSGLPNIQKKSLDDLKILFPKSKEEQIAISDILTTADREITELEKKLSIIKDQKKFLLNNLITGVIRTPENLSIK